MSQGGFSSAGHNGCHGCENSILAEDPAYGRILLIHHPTNTHYSMNLKQFSAFFFDLDGTLVDSAPDIIALIRLVLEEAALPVPAMNTRLIGPPLEDIMAAVAPQSSAADQQALVLAYRKRYRVHDYAGTRVFSGIPGLLQRLRAQGAKLFVATNKPNYVTRRLLDRKGLLPLFTDIVCRDSDPEQPLSKCAMVQRLLEQYTVPASQAVMVGDSLLDMEGGRQAGVTTLAALYGSGGRETLLHANPDLIVEDESWQIVKTWPGKELVY